MDGTDCLSKGMDKDSTKNFKVLYTNSDSLMNKMSELQLLVVLHKPDCMMITKVC